MAIQLQNTFGIGATDGVKMLVYGGSGRGKTTLCATCPAPVIISAESGLLALSRFQLPYIKIENLNQLREAYQWAKFSVEANQFQTICIDSISEIAEVFLTNAKSGKKDPRQAYGEMIEGMSAAIREFRDLKGKHVYMSAKQEYVKNEVTGVVTNGPSMPGSKLGQQLPYWFDEVFQLEIEGMGQTSYRYLRTQPDFMNTAKDRSGVLDMIEAPNLGNVINKITGVIS